MKPKTQKQNILEHLQGGKTITPLEALNLFGCFRLSAQIFNLKEDGYDITTEMVHHNGKRFASYKLNG